MAAASANFHASSGFVIRRNRNLSEDEFAAELAARKAESRRAPLLDLPAELFRQPRADFGPLDDNSGLDWPAARE